jgi:hypothetical protein
VTRVPGQVVVKVYLDDREPYEVETRLIDHRMFDTTRAKHGWPKPDEAPITWAAFLAWTASRRLALIEPGMTWEAFERACVSVEAIREGRDEDPTSPGPGPG